jgi:SAM-dependent methyltransferase
MNPAPSAERDPTLGHYVPETRFGEWFQRTDIWRQYVVDEAVAELASLLPDGSGPFRTVLDVGCGEGAAFAAVRRTFAPHTLVAVDIHAGAVAKAERLAEQMGGRIEVRRADAGRLPLDSGSVDLVLCHQLLHHCTDPARALAELHRVLARGGWLLVAESCRSFLAWWPVRLLFRHPPREQYTAEQYAALIEAAGFSIGASGVMTPAPWWSVPDLGLRRRLGLSAIVAEPTQVRIAAQPRPL